MTSFKLILVFLSILSSALCLGLNNASWAASEVPESLPEIIDTANMNKIWSFVTFVCVRHGQYQLYEDEYRFLKGELTDRDFEKNGIVQAILDELPLKRYLPALATFSQHLVTIKKDYTSQDERYQAAVFKSMIITALNQEFLHGLVRIRGQNHQKIWNNYQKMDYKDKSATELMQIAGDLIALHAKMSTLKKLFNYTEFTDELNRCFTAYYAQLLENDASNYKVYHCVDTAVHIYPYLKGKVKKFLHDAQENAEKK